MPTKKAPSAFKAQYNGSHGNASRTELFDNLAATAAETVVELGRFAPGVIVDEFRLVHGALGAGVTLDIGVIYPMGDAVDAPEAFGNFDVAAAGTKKWEGVPKRFDREFMLVATVKGAVATGRIDLVVDYRNIGNGHTA